MPLIKEWIVEIDAEAAMRWAGSSPLQTIIPRPAKKSFLDKWRNDKPSQKWHLSLSTGKLRVNVGEQASSV